MPSFLSFKVHTDLDEVILADHFVTLGRGVNIFNALVEDEVAFKMRLYNLQVQVLEVFNLDELEPVENSCTSDEVLQLQAANLSTDA